MVLLTTLIAKDFLAFKVNSYIIEPSSGIKISTSKLKHAEQFKIIEEASDQISPIVIFGKWDFTSELYYAPSKLRQRLIVLYWDKLDLIANGYIKLQDCCHAVGQLAEANNFVKTHKNFLVFVNDFSGIKDFEHLKDFEQLSKLGAEITLQQVEGKTALFAVKLP
ncbi:hypothetical protein BCS42_14005 [Crenothrix sp. D3]|nr:hypothetical protein BCS42_14005 [Crenothrix sp. D3]